MFSFHGKAGGIGLPAHEKIIAERDSGNVVVVLLWS
jgi:hypothetical protein